MGRITRFLSLIFIALNSFGQQDSTSTGEVADVEILIEKDKKIILPVASKVNVNPLVRDFKLEPLNLQFEKIEPDLNWPPYKSNIDFIRKEEAFPVPGHQNHVRAGYGTLSSPLLELAYYRTVKKINIASRAYYEKFGKGPVESKNSASSSALIDISAKYNRKNYTITPQFNFQNIDYHFYGNTDHINSGFSSELPEEASFRNVAFQLQLTGGENDISYSFVPFVESADQRVKNGENVNRESKAGLNGGLNVTIDTNFSTGFDLSAISSSYEGGISYDRSLFKLKPWVSHSKEQFLIKTGFTVTSGEVAGFNSESGFYPFLNAEWHFLPQWTLFGSFESDVLWYDLTRLLLENQFLDDSLTILHPRTVSSFGGGIKGYPIGSLYLGTGIKFDSYKDLPFYIPSSSDSSRFTVIYDDQTVDVITFYGNATGSLSAKTLVGMKLNVYDYTVKSLERAWHVPSYQLSIYASHAINQKLLISTEVITQGGIQTPAHTTFGFADLQSFIDLNLTSHYLVTDRVSLFIEINNLLNKEYQKYIGYPVRGLTFKVGGKYRF